MGRASVMTGRGGARLLPLDDATSPQGAEHTAPASVETAHPLDKIAQGLIQVSNQKSLT